MQQKGIFTDAITTEELIHIIMGTFKLLKFKWQTANFEFDSKLNGGQNVTFHTHPY